MTKPIYPHEMRSFAGMDELVELALDLRWSWDHGADNIWRPLAPELWDLTRNPWIILQTVGPDKLKELADNQEFRSRVKQLSQKSRTSRNAATWFQKEYAHAGLTQVAYFSMEFMLGEALPIYSGGLGNVAGDQLKAASDLGVPVVGIGLLYQEGTFARPSQPMVRSWPFIPLMIRDNCRSPRYAMPAANGSACKSICPLTPCGCAPGRRKWAA